MCSESFRAAKPSRATAAAERNAENARRVIIRLVYRGHPAGATGALLCLKGVLARQGYRYNGRMVHRFDAVFENGVLRPLGPLPLSDHQRVTLTIADEAPMENPREAEQRWLQEHGAEYEGEWLALDGDRLLSHGPRARAVHDEARRKGVDRPLLVRVPVDSHLPSAGWL